MIVTRRRRVTGCCSGLWCRHRHKAEAVVGAEAEAEAVTHRLEVVAAEPEVVAER